MTAQARAEDTTMSAQQGPLAGITVLDFTRVLAGPFATVLLADIGAEVVKVEPPGGDDYRHIGPFSDGESALFRAANRGKKSIVLDLRKADDLATAHTFARMADVVVENFRPGVADRLGIGYAALAAVNPRLVYLSISGFGQTGPLRDRPAYDLIIQAESGLMSLTGQPDGPPTMVGEAFGDLVAGLYGAWALSSALYAREKTGKGCHIDLAMFDALLSLLPTGVSRYVATGAVPKRVGNRHPLSAPFGVFRAGGGHVAIAVLNEKLFRQFAATIDRPEIATDPRFVSDATRAANEGALREIIEAWSTTFSVGQVVERLSRAGIPAAPIADIAMAVESDQARARGLLRPDADRPRLPEQPVHFSSLPRGRMVRVPGLDEHRDEILARILGKAP
jgi:CoA:oxalate CoA-transferase